MGSSVVMRLKISRIQELEALSLLLKQSKEKILDSLIASLYRELIEEKSPQVMKQIELNEELRL